MNFKYLLISLTMITATQNSIHGTNSNVSIDSITVQPVGIVLDEIFYLSMRIQSNPADTLLKGDTIKIHAIISHQKVLISNYVLDDSVYSGKPSLIKFRGFIFREGDLYLYRQIKPDLSLGIYIDGTFQDFEDSYEIYIVPEKTSYRCSPLRSYFYKSSSDSLTTYSSYNVTIVLNKYLSSDFFTRHHMPSLKVEYYSLSGEINVKINGLRGYQPWVLTDSRGRELCRGTFDIGRENTLNVSEGQLPAGKYYLTIGEGIEELSTSFTVR